MGIESVQRKDAPVYQGSTSAQTAAVETAVNTKENKPADKNLSAKPAKESENKKAQNAFGDSEHLKNAVSDLNKKMGNSEAVFGIHEKTNRVMIKIVDKESKKVMKEYPAEETLDMIAKVWESAGIMVDEKR